MNKRSLIFCGLFCIGIISTSLAIASTPTKSLDPCDTLTGYWDGNVSDLKNNKACRTYYRLYKSNENIYFQLIMIGECYLQPPEFNAVCRQGKLTANLYGTLSGTAYENMLDMRNENYAIRLYKH